MRIVLDDKPCSLPAESVADAIDAAAALADQAGRVIVDVFVDGDRWSGPQLDGASASAIVATEVRLVSADPHELVQQTLLDASAALQDADDLQRGAAEQIQSGDLAGAMPRLGEAITIWQSVKQAVASGAELVGLDLQALQVEQRPAAQIIHGLGEQLRSLKNSLAAGDAIGLADTLLYELPAVVDSWRGLLEQMHAAVGQPGALVKSGTWWHRRPACAGIPLPLREGPGEGEARIIKPRRESARPTLPLPLPEREGRPVPTSNLTSAQPGKVARRSASGVSSRSDDGLLGQDFPPQTEGGGRS